MSEESLLAPDTTSHGSLQDVLLSSMMNGQGGGVDLQSLLAAQSGGGSGGLDLASLLAAQNGGNTDSNDDRLNAVMRYLEQQRAVVPQSEAVDESPSEAEIEIQQLEEMRRKREYQEEKRQQARELKKVMDSLYAELETLRSRNDVLAEALGACYLCFGEDPICPECNGRGVPGSLLPNGITFRQYVIPAVKRIKASQTKTQNVSPTGKRYESHGKGTVPDSR